MGRRELAAHLSRKAAIRPIADANAAGQSYENDKRPPSQRRIVAINGVAFADVQRLPLRGPKQPRGRDFGRFPRSRSVTIEAIQKASSAVHSQRPRLVIGTTDRTKIARCEPSSSKSISIWD